jgi:hypothetical protein
VIEKIVEKIIMNLPSQEKNPQNHTGWVFF